jgi:hypothetical protein
MTTAAVGDAERQAFGRRHPPQTEDRAVLLCLAAAARELLCRPHHGNDLRIGAPEGGDVHFLEDTSSAVDPPGFGPCARSDERLGLPGAQHLPVARGFPPREIHRVRSYPLRFGCSIVLTFGKVRGPDLESSNRRRPLRQFTIVPEPWRLTRGCARLGGHAGQPDHHHQGENSKSHETSGATHSSLRNATMSASSCGVSVMPANSLNMNVYCSATSLSVFDELSWK